MRAIGKLVAAALLALGLEGCVSNDRDYDQLPPEPVQTVMQQDAPPQQKPLQCVPYARIHSGIKIFGDAYTWWDKAAGKYDRSTLPEPGAVMVLNNYAGPNRGHVAVVRRIMGPREIRIDHANWLDDGSIYVNDPVQDVSGENDWSVVRVFNLKTGAWGSRLYPVQGFIEPGPLERTPGGYPGPVADRGSSMGATALIGELN